MIGLGWIVAPPEVIAKLVQLKQSTDLHTSTFTQHVAFEVVRDGFLEEHVKFIRNLYRERRDVMLQALKQYFPPEVKWTRPHGGLFLWVTLPPTLDSHKILEAAVAQKVAFVPGNSFYANPVGPIDHHMRLNFSNEKPETIREGIRRLSLAVESQLLTTYA